MSAAPEAVQSAATPRLRASDLFQLTKPGIVVMAATTALLGYVLGSGGLFAPMHLLWAALGIALVGGGGNVLNMVMERQADARMKRTQDRPIPAGRVLLKEAVLLGVLLAAVGWVILVSQVNHLTALLAAFTFASYLFLYTPLKELTSFNTVVGAIPGALPPVLGWTAATGRLGVEPLVLFLILFFWQFPHFFPLAWIHREDYERGGFRMLPLGDPGGRRTGRMSLVTCVLLFLVSLLPPLIGMAGLLYLGTAVVLGIAFLALAARFASDRTTERARRQFFGSLLYLPLLLGVLALDALLSVS